MDFPVRWTLRVLALAALIAFAAIAYAQALPTPINITPIAPTPSGLSTIVTYDARGAAGAANAGFYSRPVLVSNATLAGLGRGALRRVVPLAAMVALVEGAGWAIDELTKQVLSGPPPVTTVPPGGTFWIDTIIGYSWPTGSAAGAYMAQQYGMGLTFSGLRNCTPPDASGNGSCQAVLQFPNGGEMLAGLGFYLNASSSPYTVTGPQAQPAPVSDAALAQAIKNQPALWNDLLRNADGSVNRNPDVMNEAASLASSLSNGPAPSPTEEWDTGNQGGNPQPNAGGDFELPGFCDWATVVCDFITWAEDDDTPPDEGPVEVSEWTPTDSYNSGLGNGSCPADVPIAISNATFSFSYGPFCTLAGYLRPLVIALAYITAGFILIGASRRG